MKRNSIIKYFAFAWVVFLLTSCLDGNQMNMPPGGGGGSFIVMTYNTGANTANINSGLSPTYFSNSALTFPLIDSVDTAHFAVTIQGPVQSKDVNVTLAIDNSKLTDNYSTDSLVYEVMPDSAYKFATTTGVIKAGKTYAEFDLVVYPVKIDGLKNFMLPITATNDGNLPISSNYSTIYVHTVGNPLAAIGPLQQHWTRWNNANGTGTPAYDLDLGSAIFSPVNGHTISAESGSANMHYLLSFNYNKGVYSNWKVAFADGEDAANGIQVTVPPTILKADPVTGEFEFKFGYDNLAGGLRIIIDKFKK